MGYIALRRMETLSSILLWMDKWQNPGSHISASLPFLKILSPKTLWGKTSRFLQKDFQSLSVNTMTRQKNYIWYTNGSKATGTQMYIQPLQASHSLCRTNCCIFTAASTLGSLKKTSRGRYLPHWPCVCSTDTAEKTREGERAHPHPHPIFSSCSLPLPAALPSQMPLSQLSQPLPIYSGTLGNRSVFSDAGQLPHLLKIEAACSRLIGKCLFNGDWRIPSRREM